MVKSILSEAIMWYIQVEILTIKRWSGSQQLQHKWLKIVENMHRQLMMWYSTSTIFYWSRGWVPSICLVLSVWLCPRLVLSLSRPSFLHTTTEFSCSLTSSSTTTSSSWATWTCSQSATWMRKSAKKNLGAIYHRLLQTWQRRIAIRTTMKKLGVIRSAFATLTFVWSSFASRKDLQCPE